LNLLYMMKLAINAARWADYVQTQAVLNISICVQNQTDIFCLLLNCYLYSVSISTFCLLL